MTVKKNSVIHISIYWNFYFFSSVYQEEQVCIYVFKYAGNPRLKKKNKSCHYTFAVLENIQPTVTAFYHTSDLRMNFQNRPHTLSTTRKKPFRCANPQAQSSVLLLPRTLSKITPSVPPMRDSAGFVHSLCGQTGISTEAPCEQRQSTTRQGIFFFLYYTHR